MNNKNELRVMSFNIRYQNDVDIGRRDWEARKDKVSSMLRFHHVDIAGLQEVLKEQLDYLSKSLPQYNYVGLGRDDGKDVGEFAPIFYRKDKFSLHDWGVFWLSETPNIAGSMGWDAVCPRIATWAKFTYKETGKVFYFFNTHFDHEGQTAMEKSAYLLLEKRQEIVQDIPTIITGDFNNTPDSKVYDILTNTPGNVLNDSREISRYRQHGPNFTSHRFAASEKLYGLNKGCKDIPLRFIDFIFVKGQIDVIQSGVLADNWDGHYPSDHMPVVADIEL